MRINHGKAERMFNAANALVLAAVCAATLYPFAFVIFAALSDPAAISAISGPLFFPVDFSTYAVKAALKNREILNALRNTALSALCAAAVGLFVTICGGYFLSVGINFGGYSVSNNYQKNAVFSRDVPAAWRVCAAVLLFSLFAGGSNPVTLYLAVKRYGMLDTFWAMILPCAVNTSAILLMAAAFAQIPRSIIDAAKAEGAGHTEILTRICIPAARPFISVLALYIAAKYWNGWFHNSIYLPANRGLYTIQLLIREYNFAEKPEPLKYAAIALSILPLLCIYPFRRGQFFKAVEMCAPKS